MTRMRKYEKIKLMILDIDGTMTDGGIYYDSQGNEIKRFNVKDGLAIKIAIQSGIEFAIITGRESRMVSMRAEELGIQYVQSGVQKKYPILIKLLDQLKISEEEVGYIGDDWNDFRCMQLSGFKACPVDAAEEIKGICDYVSNQKGGYGAVRDCLEFLLKSQGQWEKYAMELYS